MLLVAMGIFLFRIDDSRLVSFLLLAGGLTAIRVLPFRRWTVLDICIGLITLYDLFSCLYAECPLPAIRVSLYSLYARWTVLDICIGLITLYDLFSCLYAECPLPAIRVSLYSLYALVAYFVFRRILSWQPAERIVRSGSDVLTGIALVLAVLSFFVFRKSVLEVGFEDTYHFRFLFRPLGYVTNVWSEILLLILGWACLSCLRRYVPLPLSVSPVRICHQCMVGNTLAYFGMGVSFVPALCVSLHLLDFYGYLFVLFPRSLCCFGDF